MSSRTLASESAPRDLSTVESRSFSWRTLYGAKKANYSLCRCNVRARLFAGDGTQWTYRCRECGATVSEGGQR